MNVCILVACCHSTIITVYCIVSNTNHRTMLTFLQVINYSTFPSLFEKFNKSWHGERRPQSFQRTTTGVFALCCLQERLTLRPMEWTIGWEHCRRNRCVLHWDLAWCCRQQSHSNDGPPLLRIKNVLCILNFEMTGDVGIWRSIAAAPESERVKAWNELRTVIVESPGMHVRDI